MTFVYSEEMKRNLQSNLLNPLALKQSDFITNAQPEEKRFSFPTETIFAYLYGRTEPLLVHTKKRAKTEAQTGGLTSQTSEWWCLCQNKQSTESCPIHDARCPSLEATAFHLSRALRTLPPEMNLCVSSVPGARHGVCTRKLIPIGTWIGPFEGKRLRPDELKPGLDTSYMWELYEDGKLSQLIDASDENTSSWMRFIQCARCKQEQNLFVFQYQGNIYYRSFRDIAVGEELLVWYDDKYPQYLGIPTGLQHSLFTNKGSGALEDPRLQDAASQQFRQDANLASSGVMSTSLKPRPHLSYEPSNALYRRASPDSIILDQRSSPVSSTSSDVTHSEEYLAPSPNSPVASELATWQCQQCLKTFTQRLALQTHVCSCQADRPYRCGQCSQAFSNPVNLRAHVVTHSSEKPFKCGFCSRAFAGATTLNNHIRTHTGKKPFACETCGKTFVQPGHLSRHESNPGECIGRVSPSRAMNKPSTVVA